MSCAAASASASAFFVAFASSWIFAKSLSFCFACAAASAAAFSAAAVSACSFSIGRERVFRGGGQALQAARQLGQALFGAMHGHVRLGALPALQFRRGGGDLALGGFTLGAGFGQRGSGLGRELQRRFLGAREPGIRAVEILLGRGDLPRQRGLRLRQLRLRARSTFCFACGDLRIRRGVLGLRRGLTRLHQRVERGAGLRQLRFPRGHRGLLLLERLLRFSAPPSRRP